MFARAMQSPRHPLGAQLIVTRRCNLSCAYCSEFDHLSPPVPTADLLRRVDRLADLGTAVITLSGGEPLLHPDIDMLVGRVRARGAIAVLLTNGFLLSGDRIRRLNRAGLDYLQISIDNVKLDSTSRKSLALLDRRLVELASLAAFQVTINSVVGAGASAPEDAYTIALRARGLGFTATCGVLHDANGQLRGLTDPQRAAVDRILNLAPSMFSFAQFGHFQANILRGQPNQWHCPAGGRFLYVCEDGLVHYCSQQRGHPGIPIEAYSAADLVREAGRPKPCAPFCTVSCVHQVAMLDRFREHPREALEAVLADRNARNTGLEVPAIIRLLSWAFLEPRRRARATRVALRALGLARRDARPGAAWARRPGGGTGDVS